MGNNSYSLDSQFEKENLENLCLKERLIIGVLEDVKGNINNINLGTSTEYNWQL